MAARKKDKPEKPEPDDMAAELGKAAQDQRKMVYVLRLYVAGMSPRSSRAIQSVQKLCEEYLPGRYELEVVDVYQHPEAARTQQVIAAPTLVKSLPLPLRRMIGDLTNKEKVMVNLDLREVDDDDKAK